MKKITSLALFMLAFVLNVWAERVSPLTAHDVAQGFLNAYGVKAELKDVSSKTGFTNLYFFTCEHAFVVLAADDRVHPVAGYSLSDGLRVDDLPENLRAWLGGYDGQVQQVVDCALPPDREIAGEWAALKAGIPMRGSNEVVVDPLLTTEWDQDYPYNYFCPSDYNGPGGRVYAGCVATAMAQVMKYWNYPAQGSGSHSYTPDGYATQTVNFGTTTYEWDNMPNSISSYSQQTYIDAVATLLYHCGVAVDMAYGYDGSGAYSTDVPNALINYFNYSSSSTYKPRSLYTDEHWIALLKSELDEGRPLYYSGSNQNSGHAFVCDGYRSDDYFHFNWGWSGSHNDYWAIGALNPGSGGSGSGSGTYNLDNAILFLVEPTYDLSAPVITATSENGAITLDWNAVSGVTSYDVYRDNVRIATGVTGTSYTDSGVDFGVFYDYYVRSTTSNAKSNPSNIITIRSTYRDLAPSNLTATVSENNVSLGWTGYESYAADLCYGQGYSGGGYGYSGENNTYWGQCYPSSGLSDFGGMVINQVSIYIRTTGNYTAYLYEDNVYDSSNKLFEQSFSASSTGWRNITIASPIAIDTSKDLWLVAYASSSIPYPAGYGEYSGEGVPYARYIASSLEYLPSSVVNDDISWCMSASITDGNYTYTLYRDGNEIANALTSTSYNDNDLPVGSYTYYVKTNYGVDESEASNSVTAQVSGSVTSYTITASANPSEGGTVTGAGTYEQGETCTLSAMANTGYTFVNWTKNGTQVSANSTYSFTVTENGNYVANFSLNSYSIIASADPTAGGSVTGSGTYSYGETASLVATANTGYTFVNWTKNGTQVSTNANYSFTVTESGSYVAHFSLNSYMVTVKADPSEGGTVTGEGPYDYGTTATVTATPTAGWVFVNWMEDGNVLSTELSYSFTVTEDHVLEAHFYNEVGLEEQECSAIALYPNPAYDKVVIESQMPIQRIEIFSMTGQCLVSQEENSERLEIPVKDLPAGTYMIRLISGDFVKYKKLIKN